MHSFSKNKLYNLTIILIMIIAIVIRIKTYLNVRPLWHDETALACNILSRNIFGFFAPLEYLQKAPPFFMMSTELITDIFGEAEIQLRFIPLLSSIGSVFLFFFLSKKILFKKSSIIFANILFAVNYYLIYYAQEFKQYSVDVFLILASLLLFEKIELEKLSYKKILLYSLLSIIFILLSFPILFIVSAFITLNLIKSNKETVKKVILYAIPIGIACSVYYYFSILPTRNLDITYFNEYWKNGFLSPNIISCLSLVKNNLEYYFHPNNLLIILFVPISIGLYAFIKENYKMHRLIFLLVFFASLASLLHFYPIEGRIALYLIPIAILITVKPIDLFSKKQKILTIIVICSFFICFKQYNYEYIKLFFHKNIFKLQDTRTAMQIIAENYKPSEVIVYNQASRTDYKYYKAYFKLSPTKEIKINPTEYDKKTYLKILDNLPKNQAYWFYFSYDYKERPVINFVKEWLKIHHIKYKEFQYKRTHLLYIKL